MPTCESCGKESEHLIPCASCGKKLCPSCANHLQNKYLCVDCLREIYTHPVRKEEDVPEKKEEKPVGPQKMKLPVVQMVALIIILAFFILGWGYMASLPPANITEDETEAPPGIIITTNDTLTAYPHMRNYLQVTGYELVCDGGTVTGLELSFKTGTIPITLTSVELFEREIISEFSNKDFPSHTVSTTRFSNLQNYAQVDLYNTTTLELIFIANRGIYQKAVITPDPLRCQD